MIIKLNADVKAFELIGNPLGHSLSPEIHRALFHLRKLSATYALCEVKEGELFDYILRAKKELNGFNVTIPYKTEIIPYLDSLSKKAEIFGAVNTVFNDGEKLIGYNTDSEGFLRALKRADIKLEGKVLVLGCGGVSKMFISEAALAGCDITVAVREKSLENSRVFCESRENLFGVSCKAKTFEELDGGYDLIINGTPVGMAPFVGASPVKEEIINSSKAAFDAIYNPEETEFIRLAKENGLKYSNGLSMLVFQAAAAEEIWNGCEYKNDEIESVISRIQALL